MGTLTGNTPSIPEHCDHKLPTSCRLTATALCCACQDKRPHSSTYSVYVDGVGLVNRGTRWQRYCYFCKEFWQNRLTATEPQLEASQTRIPEFPDQRAFLQRWFEFHRGYRIERNEADGSQRRVLVVCERPWRDVDPGTLPLFNFAESRAIIRTGVQNVVSEGEHESIDDAFERMIEEAEVEAAAASSQIQPGVPSPQTTPNPADVTAMRGNFSLEAEMAALQQASDRLSEADARLAAAESRRERAIRELEAADTALRDCQSNRRSAIRARRNLQADVRRARSHAEVNQRAAQRFARVFGTREEIERQGADYVSPLTTMFTRAYERYRVAEEVRAEERASVATSEWLQHRIQEMGYGAWSFGAVPEQSNGPEAREQRPRTLDDGADDRPPPMGDEEMTVKLACKVCLQQKADTALLPCGHLVMCSFCADICIPASEQDRSRPAGRSACPLCRKPVKRRVMIYHA